MPYTTPKTWASGDVLTAADLNTYVRDNVAFLAAGTLGYAQVVANQVTITTNVDLTGLAVTVTVGTARRIKISAEIGVGVSNIDTTARIQIQEGATVLQRRDAKPDVSDGTTNLYELGASVVLTPAAGVHTYKLTLERVAGTGNVQLGAGTTFPAFIIVEDIGA